MNQLKLFLSSPGDCTDERNAVHRVVQRLNIDFAHSGVQIEVVAWDKGYGVPLEALVPAQISVNKHMPTPENCEIFIGIFKKRFGTPIIDRMLRKENGEIFLSGTEYEFDRAWKARRRGAQYPEIFIYRASVVSSGNLSESGEEQLSRINNFFAAPPFKEKNIWIGATNQFETVDDFEQKINTHLRHVLTQHLASHGVPIKSLIENKAKALIADAGPRYTGEIHVNSNINTVFEWLLATDKAIEQFDEKLKECWKRIPKLPSGDEKKIKDILYSLGESISQNHFLGSGVSHQKCTEELVSIQDLCRTAIDAYTNQGNEENNKSIIDGLYRMIAELEEVLGLLYQFGPYAEKRALLLIGGAGQGKTHTLVHQANKIVREGGVAIGILCQALQSSFDLAHAIAQKISPAHTFDELLDALENAAVERHSRALIAIDAINETPNRKRWRHELPGILQNILKRPHLTVVLSVRTDYRDDVVPTISEHESPWAECFHPGFSNIEPEALQAYCSYHKAKVPLAPFVGEVSNPLYLQLLVKTLASKKEALHYFPSWMEIWESFAERLEGDVRDRLDIEPSRKLIIKRILRRIASAMLDSGIPRLARHEADAIAERISGTKGVINFLCSSGVLMSQLEDDVDYIIFGFERLTETFFTDCLLVRIFADCSTKKEKKQALIEAIGKGKLLGFLKTKNNGSALFQLRYGLLRTLCAAAPAHIGAELPELPLFENADEDEQRWLKSNLYSAFLDSLKWRSRPEEFGCSGKRLLRVYHKSNKTRAYLSLDDRQILYALLPDHPIGTAFKLHNILLNAENPGARDAFWTILITELWFKDSCTLRSLSQWAIKTDLSGISTKTALPAARLLAWACTVSQEKMRLESMQALTKVLTSCPECTPFLLNDFLLCNDAYVVEAVLISTLGKVQYSVDEHAICSAKIIYNKIFKTQSPIWCHITIRHYARKIIEHVIRNISIDGIKIKNIIPPYKSSLPLETVPKMKELEDIDNSSGYIRIIHSALHHDFFWYVMGGTSGGKPFLSVPLPSSKEPERSYGTEDWPSLGGACPGIFDIPLAARFVVQNCLHLGWTADRFDSFEKTIDYYSRIEPYGRTERIGKKYQWISWHTMLAFLSDNYEMNPTYRDKNPVYDSPEQIGYIKLYDPLKWLPHEQEYSIESSDDHFWNIPSMPRWPNPQKEHVLEWAKSSTADLNPSDIILHCPVLPPVWGPGPWLYLYASHVWRQSTPPGSWRTNKEFMADIWVQIVPRIIRTEDLPTLMDRMKLKKNQNRVLRWGSIYLPEKWEGTMALWHELKGEFDQGIQMERNVDAWLPVPSMSMLGQCGPCGEDTDSTSVLLPLPRLFREWSLELDISSCCVKHSGNILFGIAGLLKKNALFAHAERFTELLKKSGYTLVWLVRGERRAFLDIHSASRDYENFVLNDYHHILYLGEDGRPNGIYKSCKHLHEEGPR